MKFENIAVHFSNCSLVFDKVHLGARFLQRMQGICPTDEVDFDELEAMIKRRGVWYIDPITYKRNFPNYALLCIVNNLYVFAGRASKSATGEISLNTVYPYKKKLRTMLVKSERALISWKE